MRKSFLYVFMAVFAVLAIFLLYEKTKIFKKNLYFRYLKHKKILFLIKNSKSYRELSENSLREILSKFSLFPEKITKSEEGIEIYFSKIGAIKLFYLINEFEKMGWKIEKLSAKDYTGKGNFEVSIFLKQKAS